MESDQDFHTFINFQFFFLLFWGRGGRGVKVKEEFNPGEGGELSECRRKKG